MDTGHLLSQSQEIEIQVFPMDAEILFSTSPFAVVDRGITGYHGSGSLGKFSFVAPSKVLRIATPPTSGPVLVDISSHLPPLEESAAVLVQLMAGDCTCSLPVYAAGLRYGPPLSATGVCTTWNTVRRGRLGPNFPLGPCCGVLQSQSCSQGRCSLRQRAGGPRMGSGSHSLLQGVLQRLPRRGTVLQGWVH
mmetsp:Transcript_26086/g.73043  ORF Transcript_26086/g.73043 Transcript_26086/m.73043 type:complete len:192 (-) Transcript_26086:508-1083(-)